MSSHQHSYQWKNAPSALKLLPPSCFQYFFLYLIGQNQIRYDSGKCSFYSGQPYSCLEFGSFIAKVDRIAQELETNRS